MQNGSFPPTLFRLYLNGNHITAIAGAFDNLPNLEVLWLGNNKITSISGAFDNLVALRELFIDNNEITAISGAFGNLMALEKLYLYKNEIESIQDQPFAELSSLIYLDLSFNKIKSIDPLSFTGLSSVKTIYLCNNRLHTLQGDTFGGGLDRLEDLYLFDSNIATIEAGAFADLPSLKELRLDRNALTELSSGALEGSYSAENFYLSNNQLDHRRLNDDLFLPFDELDVLDMTGNPNMECDKFNFPDQDLDICNEGADTESTRQRLLDPEDDWELEQRTGISCSIFGVTKPCTDILHHLNDGLIGTVLELGDLATLATRPDNCAFYFTVEPNSGPAVVTGIQFSSGSTHSDTYTDPVYFELYGAPEKNGQWEQWNYTRIGRGEIDPFVSRYQTTPLITFLNTDKHASFRLALTPDTEGIAMGNLRMGIGEVTLWVAKPDVSQGSLEWLLASFVGLGCALVVCLAIGVAVRYQRRRAKFNCAYKSYTPLEEENTLKMYKTEIPEPFFIPLHKLKFGKALGQGGYGTVCEGTFGTCPVAIKQMRFESMMWSDNAKCWERECEVLAKIQHPSCVAFYGCSESKDCLVIVQELCAGGDLRRAILDHPEAVLRRGQDFMLEIAGAFEYLHSKNIVHRDLKPENVLLSETDVECASLKVCDFGLSKSVSVGTHSTMTGGLGTMRYMAPELLGDLGSSLIPGWVSVAGSNHIDGKKCDVYAAAMLYSEILQPRSLSVESSCPQRPLAMLAAVVHENYRPPLSEAVPLKSAALVRRMWDADPSVRPSFSAVLAELEHVPFRSESGPSAKLAPMMSTVRE
jgi:hypothetical protein